VRALFVGINPGMRSAAIGHHFAGFSNRFWKLLFEAGLVPEGLTFADDSRLPEFGYGITNLVARATPGIGDLAAGEYAAGRRRLLAKVHRHHPQVVVLIGVTLYRALFPQPPAPRRSRLDSGSSRVRQETGEPALTDPLGLRQETFGGARVFVLPNPSGRNANYSYAEMLEAFTALRQWLENSRQ
jgi:TDG/mug DNA glycosylase family protein